MSRAKRSLAVLSVALAVASAVPPAFGAGFFEKNFWMSGPRYDSVVPLCDAPGVIGTIRSRFAHKESRFWNSNLEILTIDRVREVAWRPWEPATIPRRFCTGSAAVSDGKVRRIHYSVAEDLGMIGVSYGVEWCVVGLDRNWSYNPHCKMALP